MAAMDFASNSPRRCRTRDRVADTSYSFDCHVGLTAVAVAALEARASLARAHEIQSRERMRVLRVRFRNAL